MSLKKPAEDPPQKLLAPPKEELEIAPAKEAEKIKDQPSEDEVESIFTRHLPTHITYLSLISIFVLGLIFIGGYYYVLIKDLPKDNQMMKAPVTKEPLSFTLEINNPEDEILSYDKSVLVSGKTSPKTTVILYSLNNQVVTESNNSGDFSSVVNLDSGLNEITIKAFDNLGNEKSQTRTVFYSEEKIQ